MPLVPNRAADRYLGAAIASEQKVKGIKAATKAAGSLWWGIMGETKRQYVCAHAHNNDQPLRATMEDQDHVTAIEEAIKVAAVCSIVIATPAFHGGQASGRQT